MKRVFGKRPWLLVVVAFILLIAAWTILISIAVKNRPEDVPLKEDVVREGKPGAD